MRLLTLLRACLANLFAPWGIASGTGRSRCWRSGRVGAKSCSSAGLGAFEVFVAKLRLFRVPELLAVSFVLALVAVTSFIPRRGPVSDTTYAQLLGLAAGVVLITAVVALWRRSLSGDTYASSPCRASQSPRWHCSSASTTVKSPSWSVAGVVLVLKVGVIPAC